MPVTLERSARLARCRSGQFFPTDDTLANSTPRRRLGTGRQPSIVQADQWEPGR
jgi:hypothetical protein